MAQNNYGCTAQDFTETVRYLLEQGIKASEETTGNFNPLQCFLNCSVRKYENINEDKKQSVVTVCRMLLDAMKRETGLSLPVPKVNVLYGLTAISFQRRYNSQDQRAIDLIMQLIQMLLRSGVNPHSVLPSRRSLMYEVNNDLVGYRKHTFKATAEFCRLLFIYGEKPDELHWFLFEVILENSIFWKETIFNAVSLMAPDVLHDLKTHVTETIKGTRNKCKNYEIFKCIRWVKSLQDTCRCVLYNNIPHRRMAAHVDQLPLPPPLKDFLLFQ